MTNAEIIKHIDMWHSSPERAALARLQDMYEAKNPEIIQKGINRLRRKKTPNNVIPTAYYGTVVDTMAGYMFSDVQYVAEDETKQETFDTIAEANNLSVKDMQAGIASLAYNKAVEYVYSVGGSDNANFDDIAIKVSKLNPLNTIIIYGDSIEPAAEAAINYSYNDGVYTVLYVEPKLERRFRAKDNGDGMAFFDEQERPLFFDALPVIEYRAQVIGKKAPFQQIIPYINGLDALVSGNANEIDRLVDALLVLGKKVGNEDLEHMEEWKVLQDMSSEERAEYLTKDTSPEFRKYVSELLIREIHKHSHVIDWYSADNGNTSDASGKALRTRLFDMDMYSKRIEMAYREGAQKRNEAIETLCNLLKTPIGKIKVDYKRTMIDDFIDDAVKLSTVTFISEETKREYLGLDEAVEQERLAVERPAAVEIFSDDVE